MSEIEGLVRIRTCLIAALVATFVSACSERPKSGAAASDGAEPKASDYVESPTVLSAVRGPGGALTLAGRAAADSIVRLSTPEGQSWGMTAGSNGDWSFSVPVAGQPRMLSLTAESGGRAVHADGVLIVLPRPAIPLVVARVGYGAIAINRRVDRPVIVALDYDGGGGAIVSGLARPGASIKLMFDNTLEGEARADKNGLFAAPAVKHPLSPGDHLVRIEAPEGAAQLSTRIVMSEPLGGMVYRATRQDDGWRLDWRAGEHATQTTLIFDSAQQLLEEPKR